MMQENSHEVMALKPSTFGESEVILLNILIRTRNNVTSSVILPGTLEGSIRKLTCKRTKWNKIGIAA